MQAPTTRHLLQSSSIYKKSSAVNRMFCINLLFESLNEAEANQRPHADHPGEGNRGSMLQNHNLTLASAKLLQNFES